ncbi:MAG: hypothetical protein IJF60_02820 [Agathobacter sp.]|nr:hypothetical protein [Agathobacter sp.]
MYLFSIETEKKSITAYAPILILVVVLLGFSIFANSMTDNNLSREKEILQNAIDRSITQCYALEGVYPDNLEYLEEEYGLTYNKEHFFVDYQYIGSNLRPDITIIERQ